MHHVLFAPAQRVRRFNHVKLPVSVVLLLHDPNYLIVSLVAVGRILPDICKTLIDHHVYGVKRDIIRI